MKFFNYKFIYLINKLKINELKTTIICYNFLMNGIIQLSIMIHILIKKYNLNFMKKKEYI